MLTAIITVSCSNNVDLNGDWKITSVGSEILESSEAQPTLSFNSETGRIHGYTGVNIVNGNYSLEGRKLSINGIGATMMAGPDKEMELERNILTTIEQATKTQMTESGELQLLDSDDQIIMTLERK